MRQLPKGHSDFKEIQQQELIILIKVSLLKKS